MSAVVHPKHYNAHPSGIECLDVVERLDFCTGNAVKYIWRADHKGRRTEDLEKAAFYLDRILQAESTAVMTSIPHDPVLARYAARILHSGGWSSGVIWHVLMGVVEHNKMHIAAARNSLYEAINNPLEKRHGARTQLPA